MSTRKRNNIKYVVKMPSKQKSSLNVCEFEGHAKRRPHPQQTRDCPNHNYLGILARAQHKYITQNTEGRGAGAAQYSSISHHAK
jgi:hypothetical protein